MPRNKTTTGPFKKSMTPLSYPFYRHQYYRIKTNLKANWIPPSNSSLDKLTHSQEISGSLEINPHQVPPLSESKPNNLYSNQPSSHRSHNQAIHPTLQSDFDLDNPQVNENKGMERMPKSNPEIHPKGEKGSIPSTESSMGPRMMETHPLTFPTMVEGAQMTRRHPLPTDIDSIIPHAGMARANQAVDRYHVHGSCTPYNAKLMNLSVLQQHVYFFDRDQDGMISLSDTFLGFRALGFNLLFCLMAMMVVNGGFSYWTQDSWIPDPFFRIPVKNIHRAKHGSDSGVYDTEGRFVPIKFEELFSKYASSPHGDYLTLGDVWELLRGMRNIMDPFGWMAALVEWGTLVLLVGERNPTSNQVILRREYIRAQYDGSLFYLVEQERNKFKDPGTTPAMRQDVPSKPTLRSN